MKLPAVTPTWAARVWVEDDHIFADLPLGSGPARHHLVFPNDAQGITRLLFLVRSRTAKSKLGSAGDLTQHQLDKLLYEKAVAAGKVRKAKAKAIFTPQERTAAREVLRKMGMI